VTALRTPWVRVAVLAAVALAAAATAIGVREFNGRAESRYAVPGDGRLLVGFISDPGSARDREIAKGVRAWLRRLDETSRGIPFADGRVTAVELVTEAVGADQAGAATRRLVDRGATAIIGPSDQNALASVIEQVRGKPVLVLSALPRGRSVRRVPQAFYLTRAEPYGFATVYDVLNQPGRKPPSRRVTVLTVPGPYRLMGLRAAAVARTRGGRPTLVTVEGNAPPRDSLEAKAAVVVVAAPLKAALRWFRTAPRRRGMPWVIGAGDVGPALAAAGRTTVAVSVPWSPTSNQGEAGAIADIYTSLHGGLATTDAAAGATLGTLIARAVQAGKSTTGSRLIGAMERLDVLTPWGQTSFKNGESVLPPAQVILLENGSPQPVFPFPPFPTRLKDSLPPLPTPTPTPTPPPAPPAATATPASTPSG
jgi:hypothetical protein